MREFDVVVKGLGLVGTVIATSLHGAREAARRQWPTVHQFEIVAVQQ